MKGTVSWRAGHLSLSVSAVRQQPRYQQRAAIAKAAATTICSVKIAVKLLIFVDTVIDKNGKFSIL